MLYEVITIEEFHRRIDDPKLKIDENSVMVKKQSMKEQNRLSNWLKTRSPLQTEPVV